MSKHLDDVETKIDTLCESETGMSNMPQFLIYNNQNVTIHHHYSDKENKNAIIGTDRKRYPEPVE